MRNSQLYRPGLASSRLVSMVKYNVCRYHVLVVFRFPLCKCLPQMFTPSDIFGYGGKHLTVKYPQIWQNTEISRLPPFTANSLKLPINKGVSAFSSRHPFSFSVIRLGLFANQGLCVFMGVVGDFAYV